ncbi:MAG: hypothetical protein AB7F95_11430 [Burkholderiales bacterium]
MQSHAGASLRHARLRLVTALALAALLYLKVEDVKPSQRRQFD